MTAKRKTATKPDPRAKTAEWFQDARFGMFIHWGLYSMPARHEWIRNIEQMTDERYQVYFDLFNPDLFQPREWAKKAREAGMKYFVITTKHHEGFCLWDSKYTDYKAPNTPAGRDLLREVVDAFRAEGLRVGFYYSLIDWHHPDFVTDNRIGPYRNLPPEEMAKRNKGRDMHRYAQYMRNQVTELLTNYGQIDIMWFDFSYPGTDATTGKGHNEWESEKLLALVHKLQPQALVDNRLDIPPDRFTIVTPEQYTPAAPIVDDEGHTALWEGCQTFSGSWGYHRDEMTWKSSEMCVQMLVDHVARGGNLLMNVGPTSRGFFDDRAVSRLEAYAKWMSRNSRSIYGCGVAPFPQADGCRYTYNPKTKRLYVHIYSWPFQRLYLPGLSGKIRYAQLLEDGSEITFTEDNAQCCGRQTNPDGAVTLFLPTRKPDALVPVIEVVLKG